MLKTKMILAAVAAIGLAFGAVALSAKNAADDVELLTVMVDQLKAEQAVKQEEVNALATELELADFTLSRILAERESIAAIHAANDKEQDRLRTELAQARSEVAQLKVSSDEHTKDWANTVMPAAAVRLLKYADTGSNNPDGDSNKDSSPGTTKDLVAKLPTNYRF